MIKKAINQNDSFRSKLLNYVDCNNIFSNKPINRFRSNARKEIKFRDQKGMISYARRLRRGGAKLAEDNIPVANHLLMNGLLVSVNGNVFDIGYPAWLFNRFDIEKDTTLSQVKSGQPLRKNPDPEGARGEKWP